MPCAILVVIVLSRRSSGCRVVHAGIGTAANGGKVFCNGSGHLQDPGTGMPHESAWHLKQPPAHGGDAMPAPALPQGGVLEQNKEVMGEIQSKLAIWSTENKERKLNRLLRLIKDVAFAMSNT